MRFFIAGIMQGSHTVNQMHDQDYRQRIAKLLVEHFPGAEIYDPLAAHRTSLKYDTLTGREVFFRHNLMCREVDVLLAFLPSASMGTAIEMWEAHQNGAAVISISPMTHNWVVKYLSHAVYADETEFLAALQSGEVARTIAAVLEKSAGSDSDAVSLRRRNSDWVTRPELPAKSVGAWQTRPSRPASGCSGSGRAALPPLFWHRLRS